MIRLLFFSSVLFLGPFLLFMIQPLAGKILTPLYGGGAQVWCMCMLFFQLVVLGGYGLSVLISRIPLRIQGWVYAGLMILAAVFIQLPTLRAWVPIEGMIPSMSLLVQLGTSLAFSCVILSTISSTLQNWFYLAKVHDNPYPFYGLSNGGSLLALLSYPLIVEPRFAITQTLSLWNDLFWLLVGLTIISSVLFYQTIQTELTDAKSATKQENSSDTTVMVSANTGDDNDAFLIRFFGWTTLSMIGSVVLLSFTNHITHDIAPVPLLWVLPLALYLLSFVIAFNDTVPWMPKGLAFLNIGLFVLLTKLDLMNPWISTSLTLLLMLSYCVTCHGGLYQSRPNPKQLPIFYLAMSLGGALGGIFVNFIAPFLFSGYEEYVFGNMAVLLFSILLVFNQLKPELPFRKVAVMTVIAYVMFVSVLTWKESVDLHQTDALLFQERNFYGANRVFISRDNKFVHLANGNILHGVQPRQPESGDLILKARSYYGGQSGVALALDFLKKEYQDQPIRSAVIGLGAGGVAAYGRPQDEMLFLELDPMVVHIAKKYFSFLKESPAQIKTMVGDGRLSLEKLEARYDLIMIDAFTSDAIPVHLLTLEAFKTYQAHLTEQGVLVFHVSNNYLDLTRVIREVGTHLGMQVFITDSKAVDEGDRRNIYVVVTNNPKAQAYYQSIQSNSTLSEIVSVYFSEPSQQQSDFNAEKHAERNALLWRDDFSNIFSVMKFNMSEGVITQP